MATTKALFRRFLQINWRCWNRFLPAQTTSIRATEPNRKNGSFHVTNPKKSVYEGKTQYNDKITTTILVTKKLMRIATLYSKAIRTATAISALITGIIIGAVEFSAKADVIDDCNSADHQRIIRGCGEVIESKNIDGDVLAVAFSRRASAFSALGRFDEAIVDLKQAAQLDPETVSLRHALADAYAARARGSLSSGDIGSAIKDLRAGAGVESAPDRITGLLVETLALNGAELMVKGSRDEAAAALSEAIDLAPTVDLYWQRALVYRQSDRRSEAIGDYDKVIELDAGRTEAYRRRAELLLRGGAAEIERAIADLSVVLDRTPADIEVVLLRGLANEKAGLSAAARSDFEGVLARDKDNIEAKAAISRVLQLDDNKYN